ncbi:helix-turn-helix domain-containing protein [Nocardia sp. NBC_00508]|uniref:PucR family transcriptional regulator n=1 Tax=Nocardia sp. NBC_00508 TaxID=2975992 RepID=UPI002E80CB43|nr:helix-turn-helix domain-containing protein [Nocardia sp. NBC_00508]WUD66228.1 helix-turn-helix domain-containing protein [Nocardia sp. NBC_00508]
MLTLRRLVADPALGLEVVTPDLADSLDREIVWLHTTELPDPSRYIRARELVLTNGLWQPHVTAEAFVDSVARARAAGLVFGLTAQTPAIPPGLAESCRSRGLPLVELCIGVPFAAITEAASRIQNETLQAELTATVHRGNALATSLSRGGGAAGVLEILRRDTDLPLLVVDRMGRCLASIGCELTDDQIRRASAALNRTPPPIEVDIAGAASSALYLVEGVLGDIDAGLYCLRPTAELTPADKDALAQAARFLSLEVTKQQAVHAIEARFAGELLEMVLSGPRRAGEVSQRLAAYGVPPDRTLAVLAIVPSATDESAPSDGIGDAVGAVFSAKGIPVFIGAGSRDVVAIFAWDRTIDVLSDFARELSAEIGRRVDHRRIVIGVGELAADAGALREPLIRAREICHVLRAKEGMRTATFADIATYRMLLGLIDNQSLRQFSGHVLGIIRDHDARARTELERTLRTFLAHDGQWAVTAAALHVHVNTLRNRITRITELTGRDVNRIEDKVDLFLALEAESFGSNGSVPVAGEGRSR